ncbi:MAG TPA: hypothetical protein PKD99_15620 [Sphingopyxis sp.]|nr:hypothetical protein [Sphingopyxis sp.]HMP46527.1 hypothetical protein [Sphingopyxis sp.]HMQ19231.1 hypothetical protein [Sphingopyxis sp.]
MVKMSIGAAFSETFAFLKANWTQMLIWIGGTIILLGLLGYLFLGSTFSALAVGDPSAIMGAFGPIGLFALIAAIILYAVCMLIWRGGMHSGETPNFGWALQAGPAFAFGMLVVMIAAYIVVFIVMLVFGLIFGAAVGGMGGFMSGDVGAAGGIAMIVGILLYIAILVFMLWVQGRFIVAGPVMADRLTRNPITGLSESWKLTNASQWTIVGFYLLFTILLVVYALVAGMIFGAILGGVASGGSMAGLLISMIVSAAVIYLPILMVSVSMPVGVYRAIAPRASGDVFA